MKYQYVISALSNQLSYRRLCLSISYSFLFDFNRNRASILYRFRDIAGYLWKVADFDPPHLHLAPP